MFRHRSASTNGEPGVRGRRSNPGRPGPSSPDALMRLPQITTQLMVLAAGTAVLLAVVFEVSRLVQASLLYRRRAAECGVTEQSLGAKASEANMLPLAPLD